MARRAQRGWPRTLAGLASAVLVLGLLVVATAATPSSSASPRVLRVGTFHGVKGQFKTIQAAANAARPGDWILVAPGDYHEVADASGVTDATAQAGDYGGVLITTPRVHLRGMNRNTVIVDGTKAGAPEACDPDQQWQNFGPTASNGDALGRNGVVAWKASGVSIQNLTACNFLSGTGDSGNEIWWNGGDDSGKIGATGYSGSYLTGTSTYIGGEASAAAYGLFVSNSHGPGSITQVYASNMNDSGIYVGGCQQVCGMTISHAWMEYNALGYSGTNSGGAIVIEHSQFDNNKDGFDTDSQIDGDAPAPQNGDCPGTATSSITHTRSCWVFMDNDVHNNNNPDTPQSGAAANGPTGTGMTVSGGENDTVMNNVFADNGAWGMLFVPYPDANPPVHGQTCAGTGGVEMPGLGCVYDPSGDALLHNTFVHNGYFGNPSNSDYGQIALNGNEASNCFAKNTAPDGSAPADLEQVQPKCGPLTSAGNSGGDLLAQVLCDTGFGSCPAGASYPQPGTIVMHPLPKLASMPNACTGVPTNPWCEGGKPI
jgi:hypothetical protein